MTRCIDLKRICLFALLTLFLAVFTLNAFSVETVNLLQSKYLLENGAEAARKGVNNPISGRMARVIPGEGNYPTLDPPGRPNVFVTALDDIAGMNAAQIA